MQSWEKWSRRNARHFKSATSRGAGVGRRRYCSLYGLPSTGTSVSANQSAAHAPDVVCKQAGAGVYYHRSTTTPSRGSHSVIQLIWIEVPRYSLIYSALVQHSKVTIH